MLNTLCNVTDSALKLEHHRIVILDKNNESQVADPHAAQSDWQTPSPTPALWVLGR